MRELTLTVLHGETDLAAETARYEETQIRLGVARDKIGVPPCEVTAIYMGEGIDPVAVHFSKWEDVADLKLGMKATFG